MTNPQRLKLFRQRLRQVLPAAEIVARRVEGDRIKARWRAYWASYSNPRFANDVLSAPGRRIP